MLRALCVLRILNPLEHVDQADTAADQRPAADVRQLQWRTSTVTGRLRASTALICLPNTAEPSRSPTPAVSAASLAALRSGTELRLTYPYRSQNASYSDVLESSWTW